METLSFALEILLKLTRLRELRGARFLSQVDLARKAGISEHTIIRLEKGRTSPKWQTIRKLAKALGVEPGELVLKE